MGYNYTRMLRRQCPEEPGCRAVARAHSTGPTLVRLRGHVLGLVTILLRGRGRAHGLPLTGTMLPLPAVAREGRLPAGAKPVSGISGTTGRRVILTSAGGGRSTGRPCRTTCVWIPAGLRARSTVQTRCGTLPGWWTLEKARKRRLRVAAGSRAPGLCDLRTVVTSGTNPRSLVTLRLHVGWTPDWGWRSELPARTAFRQAPRC